MLPASLFEPESKPSFLQWFVFHERSEFCNEDIQVQIEYRIHHIFQSKYMVYSVLNLLSYILINKLTLLMIMLSAPSTIRLQVFLSF